MKSYTDHPLILVESLSPGNRIESFPSRLNLVLELLNNGNLGATGSWGDEQHREALTSVRRQLNIVQEAIEQTQKSTTQ